MEDEALIASFRAGAPGPRGDAGDAAAPLALRRLFAVGQAAYPSLPLSLDALATHVGRLVGAGAGRGSTASRIEALHAADVYLAAACALGVTGAAATFEREYLARLPAFLHRMKPTPQFLDEVRQALAVKVLVADAGRLPRIAEYSGRGPLAGWFRVVALRLAVDLHREPALASLPGDSRGGGVAGQLDPELDHLKRRHGADFRAALRESLAELPQDRRELLWLHFVEGLNIEAIGARRQVHRATVARWLAAARASLLERTRGRLAERLQLHDSELSSLLGALRSELDVSIGGLLAPRPSAPRSGEAE